MAVNGWANIETMKTSLAPTVDIVAGWKQVSEMSVDMTLSEVIIGGWAPVSEMLVGMTLSEVIIGGWKEIETAAIVLSPPGMQTCSTDADCPEGYVCDNGMCVKVGAGFPWIAAGVAAAAVGGVVLIAKPKKSKTKRKTMSS